MERIDPAGAEEIEDTVRTGWRVAGEGMDGPFVFEQLAYLRERDGQVGWLRVMCTGPRPAAGFAGARAGA